MPQCKQCQKDFKITEKDKELLERLSPTFVGEKFLIPPPRFCPDCRYQQRLTFRNERNLYRRKSDISGKEIVSIYSPDGPVIAYEQKEWYGDKWNPLDYGREFDFSRSFFEQYNEMKLEVPRIAISNARSFNSEYTNQAQHNKNCYLITSSNNNEDCYYSHWVQDCHLCMDALMNEYSELCYECINIFKCYNSKYLQNCSQCTDCFMCFDCKGCHSCIGCYGLRNQKYQIFNQPVSQEEFSKKLKEVIENRENFKRLESVFLEKIKELPRQFYWGFNNENFSGDYLQNTKGALFCFNCRDIYETYYAQDAWRAELCLDMTETLENKGCYQLQGCAYNNNSLFCSQNWENNSNIYCDLCIGGGDCFGCVGVLNSRYCIFNKQYEQDEYEKLVAKIIRQMQKTGEWGEFYPTFLTSFAYNESVAHEYFPLTREEAKSKGFRWREDDPKDYQKQTYQVPEKIEDVPEAIIKEVLVCVKCGKNYRIIPQELEYYQKHNIPVPKKCPDCRHLERMALRNPRQLWDRQCDQCGKFLESTYTPGREEKVYCEECYQKEIY